VYTNIPQHIIQDVKDRLSIVKVIGRYVELKKAGRNWKGLCPFHNENAPSFNVSEESGFFHCFGCTEHGDVISFVSKIENLSFIDSVRTLAKEAGVELPEIKEMTAQQKSKLDEHARLLDINREALGFFQKMLITDTNGKMAQEYLKNRGVSKQMVEAFMLGYAPKSWDAIIKYFKAKNIDNRDLVKASLAKAKDRGGAYDTFRHRVMFPIVMENNRVVGFGGRALDDDDNAKYINSPESPVFYKSKTLYGYNLARSAIAAKKRVLVVEGNLDVVMMHQYGFNETVATLGTALTEHHLRILKRMTANIVIIYDGDSAGKKAMFRSLDLFLTESINSRAVVLPDGHDPDSFLRKHSSEELDQLIEQSRYLFDIWLEDQYAMMNNGPRGVSECLHGIVPMLAKVEAVERALYLEKISTRLSVNQNVVRQLLRQHATQRNWDKESADSVIRQTQENSVTKIERAELMILGLLVHFPETVAGLFETGGVLQKMTVEPLRDVSMKVLFELKNGSMPDFNSLVELVDEKEWKNKVANLLINPWSMTDLTVEDVKSSFVDCLNAIDLQSVEEEIEKLNTQIREMPASNGDEKLQLIMKRDQLHQQLHKMKQEESYN